MLIDVVARIQCKREQANDHGDKNVVTSSGSKNALARLSARAGIMSDGGDLFLIKNGTRLSHTLRLLMK